MKVHHWMKKDGTSLRVMERKWRRSKAKADLTGLPVDDGSLFCTERHASLKKYRTDVVGLHTESDFWLPHDSECREHFLFLINQRWPRKRSAVETESESRVTSTKKTKFDIFTLERRNTRFITSVIEAAREGSERVCIGSLLIPIFYLNTFLFASVADRGDNYRSFLGVVFVCHISTHWQQQTYFHDVNSYPIISANACILFIRSIHAVH